MSIDPGAASWTFLTNHAHTVIYLARHPDAVVREIAVEVGITERAVHNIISDLEESGVLTKIRDGRRNRYRLHLDRHLRHPLESHRTIGELVALVKNPKRGKRRATTRSGRVTSK